MKKVFSGIYKYRVAILLVLLISYVAYLHGFNLTKYPYYESDEGTYTSQAWSVITQDSLSPYTYWYDHPPVAWLVISAWYSLLPDSYFTFGNSIDTARVLMWLLFIVNSVLVFHIVNKLTKSALAATLAVVVYSSSPLAIYFTRRVLLDNVQVLWLLLSIVVLLPSQLSLRRYAASGVFFALAFLTKITAVMFGLPMLFLLLALKEKTHKIFRTFTWLSLSAVVTSFYFIYAAIKDELLPPMFASSKPHVSFWETISFQMSRGEALAFYERGSDLMNAYNEWFLKDPLLVLISVLTIFVGALTFFFVKNTWYRFFVLMNLFYIIFLIRGGIVINFYFVPMLPFISILFALIVNGCIKNMNEFFVKYLIIIKWEKFSKAVKPTILILITGALVIYYNFALDQKYLYVDETKNQIAAVKWVKENLPENTDILIDVAMYVELNDPNYINDKVFDNAEWFYKISRDPEIRDDKYDNNWKNFDYLLLTHEMLKQIDNFDENDIVSQAFENSLPKVKWFEDSTSFIDEQKRVTTNGDWSMLYDINSQTGVELANSWKFYKENFIFSYGQVIDPNTENTTSEGQSYAMLRSVWMNDHDTFKGVWLWTKHHLQHRLEDKLISWQWANDELVDSANAADADVDIALALLFAYKNFGDESYLVDAKEIIADIWKRSVVDINGTYYLISSNIEQSQVSEGLLFNPSYMSPAHYRIFAEVDSENNWNKLADDSYKILANLTSQNRTPLIKNWYIINDKTGQALDASPYFGSYANESSYDAFRVFWRVWLDYAWFNNQSAENYLTRTGEYLETVVDNKNIPTAINPVTGAYLSTDTSLAITSSYALPLTFVTDGAVAREHYITNIAAVYNPEGYWGHQDVYFDQNWVWILSAFYNNDLFNIWGSN